MLGKVNIFLSVIEKTVVCCRYFWLFLPIAFIAFILNSTELSSRDARGLITI